MTSQHHCSHRMTFLYFLFLFLLGSTTSAVPMGRPGDSVAYEHFSDVESRTAIISTSNVVTSSPYLSRPRHIRDVSFSDIASPTSALPAKSSLYRQPSTTNDSTIGIRSAIAIAITATAGCLGILPILFLILYRLYKAGRFPPSQAHTLELGSPVNERIINAFHGNDMRINPFTPVSMTPTTTFDSTGRPGFGPLRPVIRISHASYCSVDTLSSSSPASPHSRDRKPRPLPLALKSPSSPDPSPTGVQAMAGPLGESALLTVSSSLLSTSGLPITPPPIYSAMTPSNHITLTVLPVLTNGRAKSYGRQAP